MFRKVETAGSFILGPIERRYVHGPGFGQLITPVARGGRGGSGLAMTAAQRRKLHDAVICFRKLDPTIRATRPRSRRTIINYLLLR